jgi:hypothetical protein
VNEVLETNSADELIRLQCEMYRSLLAIIPKPTADRIGERVGYLANGAIIPGTGIGDVFTIAALMGLTPDAISAQAAKHALPQLGLGRAILYSVAGFFARRGDTKGGAK